MVTKVKKIENQQEELADKQLILEHTVDEIKGCVGKNMDKQKDFEDRIGHLEAISVKVNEIIDKSAINSQDLAGRLGTLEAKVTSLEDKVSQVDLILIEIMVAQTKFLLNHRIKVEEMPKL